MGTSNAFLLNMSDSLKYKTKLEKEKKRADVMGNCPFASNVEKIDSRSLCESKQPISNNLSQYMPSYYVPSPVIDKQTVELVTASWERIRSGNSTPFREAKRRDSTITPITFFFNTFYDRLFETAPDVKLMFRHGVAVQGKMFASMLHFIVHDFGKEVQIHDGLPSSPSQSSFLMTQSRSSQVFFHRKEPVNCFAAIRHMTILHNRMGITASQYGLSGTCLFYAIETCCGEDSFGSLERDAWVKMYSRLLECILPVALEGTVEIQEEDAKHYRCVFQGSRPITSPRPSNVNKTSFG